MGEQIGHLGRDLRRSPDPLGAFIQRSFDRAVGDGGLVAQLFLEFAQAKRAVEAARDGDGGGGTGAQGKADEPGFAPPRSGGPGLGDGRVDQHAGLQMDRVHGLGQHGHGELGFSWADASAAHGGLEGFTPLQLHRHALGRGEAGLGLGVSEGGILERRDGGGVEGSCGPRRALGQGDPCADRQPHGRRAGGPQVGRAGSRKPSQIELSHHAPRLPRVW